jgi:hypothetical protein
MVFAEWGIHVCRELDGLCFLHVSNAAPVVSGEYSPNVPRSGAGSLVTVTIAGLHFGPWNLTPTASLEDSDEATCTTSSWTSATTVGCNARRVKSSRVREAMTVAGVVGTGFSFSFDGTDAAIRAA